MESFLLRSSLKVPGLLRAVANNATPRAIPGLSILKENCYSGNNAAMIKRWQHFGSTKYNLVKVTPFVATKQQLHPITTHRNSLYGSHLLSSTCGLLTKSHPVSQQPIRCFHAAGSKVKYLDFRYRLKTHHLRLHLLIIRRQKMKKHKRRKFRKKFKCLLAKQRLKREIAKEKAFRVELLSIIRRAETFDPREYALKKLAEINNRKKELSKEEKLEQLKDLIRENRYQVDYIKPKHKRAEWVDVKV